MKIMKDTAAGVIIDIDEDKKQRQSLIRLAEIDSLTGLLYKAAVNVAKGSESEI